MVKELAGVFPLGLIHVANILILKERSLVLVAGDISRNNCIALQVSSERVGRDSRITEGLFAEVFP